MSDQDTSGQGGRQREQTTMDAVDKAVSGGGSHPASSPSNPVTVGVKAHPSSYAPAAAAPGPKVYGTPVSTPILSGGK